MMAFRPAAESVAKMTRSKSGAASNTRIESSVTPAPTLRNVKLCCGYLRVYQPLDELGSDERDRITAALHATPPPVSAVGLLAADERMEAYVLEVDGAMFVCQAQTRLRTLLGIVSFARTIPDAAVPAFFRIASFEPRSAN